jgi:hypothetical protein
MRLSVTRTTRICSIEIAANISPAARYHNFTPGPIPRNPRLLFPAFSLRAHGDLMWCDHRSYFPFSGFQNFSFSAFAPPISAFCFPNFYFSLTPFSFSVWPPTTRTVPIPISGLTVYR